MRMKAEAYHAREESSKAGMAMNGGKSREHRRALPARVFLSTGETAQAAGIFGAGALQLVRHRNADRLYFLGAEAQQGSDVADAVKLGIVLDIEGLYLAANKFEEAIPLYKRALAANPTLLLLDEPAAGLNSSEKLELHALLKRIAAQGLTILIIDHDMTLVSEAAQHITVLNFGRRIADGESMAVLRHPDVVSAYLGTE